MHICIPNGGGGRLAGWVALKEGLAGGADRIVLPVPPSDVRAVAVHACQREHAGGRTLVCIAQGRGTGGEGRAVSERIAGSRHLSRQVAADRRPKLRVRSTKVYP